VTKYDKLIQNVTRSQNAIQKTLESLKGKNILGKGCGQWHQVELKVSEVRDTYRVLAS